MIYKHKFALVSAVLLGLALIVAPFSGQAEDANTDKNKVVNVYSSRKEKLVKDLFDRFSRETGIAVNFVTDKEGKLIQRMKAEGENTPADVFLTADVGNLAYAKEEGLLASIDSPVLEQNVPVTYQDSDHQWFGLTLRARALFYNKERVTPEDLSTYEALAEPMWKGRVLVRSSSNIYNQSLVASLIENDGLEATEKWIKGLVANFSRPPQGGDTDQLKAVAAGEGDVAIANTYYYGRLAASDKPEERDIAEKIGVFFPNQNGRGTHVNISGGGVTRYAKHPEEGKKLLEFLSGPEAQRIYAEVNHEYPVLLTVAASEVVESWGTFKRDALPLAAFMEHRKDVVEVMDRGGWR